MQVKDIMTKDVVFADPSAKITEVAKTLFENRFHALPVAKDGKILGIITEEDFYVKDSENLFMPSYITFLKNMPVADDLPKKEAKEIERFLEAEAKDIMTADCLTVRPETEIGELLSLIKKTQFNSIPVVDESMNIQGIITSMDILGIIGKSQDLEIREAALENSKIRRTSQREVDDLARDVQSFWKKTFILMERTQVKTWKAVFLIAFIAGMIAALIWNVSVKIQK